MATLEDKGVASRLLRKKSRTGTGRTGTGRTGSGRTAHTSGVSDITFWTTKTGLSTSRVTNTNGVSTIAQQRRQKREQERQEHGVRQKAREQEECRLLRAQIKTCRETLTKAKERLAFLRDNNRDLVNEIKATEHGVMSNVNSLVQRYGQYATATATINHRFSSTLTEAQADLQAFSSKLDAEAANIRAGVSDLQQRIETARRDLRALLLYKESGQLELRRVVFNLKEHLDKV